MTGRIDWSQVVGQMKATNLSLRGIAHLTGLSTASVHNLSCGLVEPLHEHGERVITVWCVRTSLTREQLPRVNVQDFERRSAIDSLTQCASASPTSS